jgi:hypothetical protein
LDTTKLIANAVGQIGDAYSEMSGKKVPQWLVDSQKLISDSASGIASAMSGDMAGAASSFLSYNLTGIKMADRFFSKTSSGAEQYADQLSSVNSLLTEYDKKIKETSGEEKVKSFQKQKEALEEYRQTLLKAIEAEEGKTKKHFGGLWSSDATDQGKVDEMLKQLEGIDPQLEAMSKDWADTLSGGITNADIAGKIADAFSNGKTSVEDFASYTNEILQNAVMEIFKQEILNAGFITDAKKFLESAFYDSSGNFNGLDDTEITKFKELTQKANESAKGVADALQFDKLFATKADDAKVQTMTGAIQRSLTEETGSILAGTMNSIRIDVRSQLNINKEMNDKLGVLVFNSKYLERLVNIENLLKSNSARGVGL